MLFPQEMGCKIIFIAAGRESEGFSVQTSPSPEERGTGACFKFHVPVKVGPFGEAAPRGLIKSLWTLRWGCHGCCCPGGWSWPPVDGVEEGLWDGALQP